MKHSIHQLPSILLDNEIRYISLVELAIYHAATDVEDIQYMKTKESFKVKIVPIKQTTTEKDYELKQKIIHNLIGLHRMLYIPITFSKSTNIQSNIYYEIKN